MKKWANVRDSFQRSERQYKTSLKSGSPRQPPKTYIYGEQLRFLKKTTEPRPTHDSLSAEQDKPSRPSDDVTGDNSNSSLIYTNNSTDGLNTLGATFRKPTPVSQRKKRQADTVELELLSAIKQTPDRHMSFFRGITPTLEGFDDDEVVEFQLKVMQIIYDIKNKRKLMKGSLHSQSTISKTFGEQSGTFSVTPSTSQSTKQYHDLQPAINDIESDNNPSLVNYYESIGSIPTSHSESSSLDSLDFN